LSLDVNNQPCITTQIDLMIFAEPKITLTMNGYSSG